MANPAVPVHGETIESSWGADVVSRLVPVFADTAERDAALPAPEDGQLCVVAEQPQNYSAGSWHNLLIEDLREEQVYDDGTDESGFIVRSGRTVTVSLVTRKAVGTTIFTLPWWARPSTGDVMAFAGIYTAGGGMHTDILAIFRLRSVGAVYFAGVMRGGAGSYTPGVDRVSMVATFIDGLTVPLPSPP